MIALLDKFPTGDHDDAIGVHDGGQAVSELCQCNGFLDIF